MTKFFCDRCNREMPKPKEATDNSCRYHEFIRNDIRIHIAYRTDDHRLQQDVCPWCLLSILKEEIEGCKPKITRRIE